MSTILYAELDSTLTVVSVESYPESATGQELELSRNLGRTYREATVERKNRPTVGGTFNIRLNAFIDKKPFNSWILNETTCKWEPPIPQPYLAEEDYNPYYWDESTTSWVNGVTNTQVAIYTAPSPITLESVAQRLAAIEADEISDDATSSALLTLIAGLTARVTLLEQQ